MDDFHRFCDLPEPLRRAIFAADWRSAASGRGSSNRSRLRLVCRGARAGADAAITKVGVQAGEQDLTQLYACIRAVGAGRFPALREWRVQMSPLLGADNVVIALVDAIPPTLHKLHIQGPSLGRRAAAALAGSAAMPALRQLILRDNRLNVAALHALAQGFGLRLEVLDLSHNPLRTKCAAALAGVASARLPALRELYLCKSSLNTPGVQALMQVAWPALEILHLDKNDISRKGAVALANASSARLPSLRELSLSANRLREAGVAALVRTPWHALEVLDLSANDIKDTGAEALAMASVARLPVLRRLHLGSNRIGDYGVQALASISRSWPHLQELHLTDNGGYYGNSDGLGMFGVEALGAAGAQRFPALQTLSLARNCRCDASVRALVQQAPWPALQSLDLSRHDLSAKGMAALAAASRSQLPALRALTLGGGDQLSRAGVTALAQGDWRHMEALKFCPDLHGFRRKITGGVIALVAAGPARFPALRSLTVEGHYVSEEQEVTMGAAWPDASVFILKRRDAPQPRALDRSAVALWAVLWLLLLLFPCALMWASLPATLPLLMRPMVLLLLSFLLGLLFWREQTAEVCSWARF